MTSRSAFLLLAVLGLLTAQPARALALAAGDIVVYGGGKLVRIDPATGTPTTISSGGLLAGGFGDVVLDAQGQLNVATGTGRTIVRVNPADGTQTQVTAFTNPNSVPFGLAIEADGKLVASDFRAGNGSALVVRIDPATGNQTTVSTGDRLFLNTGTVVAPNGDLIVADFHSFSQPDGQVLRINPLTGAQSLITLGGLLFRPELASLDLNGHLLVASLGQFDASLDGRLIDVDLATGAQTLLASDLESPNDVAVDGNGNWVVTELTGRVLRIDRLTRQQTLLTSGLGGASGLLIVPSLAVPVPSSGLLALLALAMLAALARLRRQPPGAAR